MDLPSDYHREMPPDKPMQMTFDRDLVAANLTCDSQQATSRQIFIVRCQIFVVRRQIFKGV